MYLRGGRNGLAKEKQRRNEQRERLETAKHVRYPRCRNHTGTDELCLGKVVNGKTIGRGEFQYEQLATIPGHLCPGRKRSGGRCAASPCSTRGVAGRVL